MATGNAKVRAEAARHDPDLRFLGKIAVSNHASRIPVTPDGGATLATPIENGGPGAAAAAR